MRAAVLLLAIAACGDNGIDRVLVYTRTLGYRHAEAIDAGSLALPQLLTPHGIAMDLSEDPGAFTAENLAQYRAVFFMYTSGDDILDEAGKAALEDYVRGGGGWIGLHSAADTEYAWPFYRELVVAHFMSHPVIQLARLVVERPRHPAMIGVPETWDATDEWYDFASNPRATEGVDILATIDEASYTGGLMGADHPMIWAHTRAGGRVIYIAPGHRPERWSEPPFARLVERSLLWVMRRALD